MTVPVTSIRLEPGKGVATRNPEMSVSLTFERGILLMLFDRADNSGGAIHLLPEESALRERLDRMIDAVGASDPAAKVLGQAAPDFAALIRRLLASKRIPVLAESIAENGRASAVFQPALGKVRFKREVPTAIAARADPKPLASVVQSSNATETPRRKAKVLIVDDAPVIRQLLKKILSADPEIEIVGEAGSAKEADELIPKVNPDVMTLDIHMPGEDGVTFLGRLLPKRALPVVMVTSVSMEEGELVFEALALGAVDYIQKPAMHELQEMAPIICEKVRVASRIKVQKKAVAASKSAPYAPARARSKPAARPGESLLTASDAGYKVRMVAIGASTGGVQALTAVLESLPEKIPPIVIVQHIPPVFSRAFAERLDRTCAFRVKEAEDGDRVLPNQVLLAPGGLQLRVENAGSGLVVRVFDGPRVNRHKPSVEVLFNSVAEVIGPKTLGIILTGMGEDGAEGLLRIREKGAMTIAQDEASSVVWGMPGAAVKRNAAVKILPLSQVAAELMRNSQ